MDDVEPTPAPDEQRSTASVLGRDLMGPAAALVLSWTGLVVLLDAAVVGAVAGILVATRVIEPTTATRSLFDAGTAAGPYPWRWLAAALAGAGGTALSVGRVLFGSVWGLAAWLATGLLIGLCVTVLRVRGEERLLRLGRCRRPSMEELRRLARALQLAGSGVNMPGSPHFAVADTDSPLACPRLRHVVVSTGLMAALEDEELAAVLVHVEHHRRQGDALRRVFLACCGWPVLVLSGLGRDSGGGPRPGAAAGLARLVTWPATASVRLVLVPLLETSRHREEYEADAAARRAGLAKEMASALEKTPAFERRGRAEWALAPADPPLTLRAERLGVARPLDAFFRHSGSAGTRGEARRGWALATAGVAVAVLASGAVLSAANVASGRDQAVRTAATFTSSYLDAAFDPSATAKVTSSFVSGDVAGASAPRSASPITVATELAVGDVRPGRTVDTACRYIPGTSSAGSSEVMVWARWRFYVAGALRSSLLVATVPMTWAEGRWTPTAAPEFSVAPRVGGGRGGGASAGSCL